MTCPGDLAHFPGKFEVSPGTLVQGRRGGDGPQEACLPGDTEPGVQTLK